MCFRRKTPNIQVYLSYVGNYLDSLPTDESELKALTKVEWKALSKKNNVCQVLLEDIRKIFIWPVRLHCGTIPSGDVGGVGPKPPKEIEGVEIPNIHVLIRYIGNFIIEIPGLVKMNPGIDDWKEFNDRLNRCQGALNVCHLIFYPPEGPFKCGKIIVGAIL
ncbi:MAG: hypothetical protein KAT17_08945 [Candidatus Aminicenantes bacterium]|nr:hypothetical protein [Candidatus Aminicenantes bacterium]